MQRLIIPGSALAALALFAALYRYEPTFYFGLLTLSFKIPFREPFIDLNLFDQVACWTQGIDVYATAPCDILGRRFNYSPLWLRATFLRAGVGGQPWIGLGYDIVFLLSLCALPPPRRRLDGWLVAGATFSSATVFALERANIDLLIFVLAIAACACWTRALPVRVVGYLIMLLAALLKFYPLALALVVLRERPAICLAIGAALLAVLASFGWAFHDELPRAVANILPGPRFGDTIGATQLPRGAGILLRRLFPDWATALSENTLLPVAVLVALGTVSLTIAWRLGAGADLRLALAGLPPPEAILLVAGALLICGCFVAGQSFVYRAVLLLLALPGLLALSRAGTPTQLRRLALAVACAAVIVMWAPTIELTLTLLSGQTLTDAGGPLAGYLHWLLNQIAWWGIFSVLLAVIVAFVLDAPAWRAASAK